MLPTTKFYRACPELNGYSDEACDRMVLAARARRADAMWVVPLAAMLGVNAVVGLLTASTVWIMMRAAAQNSVPPPVSVLGVVLVAVVVMVVIGGWVWVAVRRVLIIRSVLFHLEKAQCPYCLFSLRGLVVDYGSVVCPECGQRIVLADEGITPEDLLAHSGMPTRPPPPGPGVDLSPLPLAPEQSPQRKR